MQQDITSDFFECYTHLVFYGFSRNSLYHGNLLVCHFLMSFHHEYSSTLRRQTVDGLMNNFDQHIGWNMIHLVPIFAIRCFGQPFQKVDALFGISHSIQNCIPPHMEQIGFGVGYPNPVSAVP